MVPSSKAPVSLLPQQKSKLPTRYIIVIVSFFGLFNMYAVRVNLSVGIVAMVKQPSSIVKIALNDTAAAVHADDTCPMPNFTLTRPAGGIKDTGEFDWDSYSQGIILASYFNGYVFTQFLGAWLANHVGVKYVMGVSTLVSGLMTLIIPVAARSGFWSVFVVRFIQGFFSGVFIPCIHSLLGKWVPPAERTKLCMMVYSGAHIGTVVSLTLSGTLADYFGWDSIFYFFGTLSCLWVIFWAMFGYNSPDEHPRISSSERDYITESIGNPGRNKRPVPWKRFATSMPVWAICVATLGNCWSFFIMQTNLPTYFARILHFPLQENGWISALPYIVLAIMMQLCGLLADKLRSRKILTTTNTRRIYQLVGQLSPAVCTVLVAHIGCNIPAAVTLLTLSVGLNAFALASFQINHIDISPNYAGILMGISNTICAIPGILGPYVVGLLTSGPDGHTLSQWKWVFYLMAGINVVTAVFYACFVSGELESWEREGNQGELEEAKKNNEEEGLKLKR